MNFITLKKLYIKIIQLLLIYLCVMFPFILFQSLDLVRQSIGILYPIYNWADLISFIVSATCVISFKCSKVVTTVIR